MPVTTPDADCPALSLRAPGSGRRPRLAGAVAALALALSGCPDGDGIALSQLDVGATVAPQRLDFGTVWAGRSESRRVRVTNTGRASTSLSGAVIADASGPGFASVVVPSTALPPGASVDLEVRLSSMDMATGLFVASLSFDVRDVGPFALPITAEIRPVPPCDDGNPCTLDRFENGACLNEVIDDGTGCDDGNACTYDTVCAGGQCLGRALTCDDDIECTIDGCDADLGCVFEPAASRCDDDDPCTEDLCMPVVGGCTNTALPVGNICYFNGCVELGLCVAGECQIGPTPNGLPCEDGDPCTEGDACLNGECNPGTALEVGPSPPVVMAEGAYATDLCLLDGSTLCTDTAWTSPEKVLAVTEDLDANVLLVWQSNFLDTETHLPCVPPAFIDSPDVDLLQPSPAPPGVPPPAGPPDEGGTRKICPPDDPACAGAPAEEAPPDVPEPPPPLVPTCSAGIFLTRLSSSPGALPSTVQLATTEGAAAASFTWSLDSLPPIGGFDPNDLVDGLLPPTTPKGRILLATADNGGEAARLLGFTEAGVNDLYAYLPRLPHGGPSPLRTLSVDRFGDQVVVAGHGSVRLHSLTCDDSCADLSCCDQPKLDVWLYRVDTLDVVTREVEAVQTDSLCDALFPSGPPWPWHTEGFRASFHPLDGELTLSFLMDPGLCGDTVYGAGPNPHRVPYHYAFDPAVETGFIGMSPLPVSPLGGLAGVDQMHHVMATGLATAVFRVEVCDPDDFVFPGVPDDDAGVPNVPVQPPDCVEHWVGTLGINGQAQLVDKLFGPLTAEQEAEAVPVVVQADGRTAARVGQSVRLVWRTSEGEVRQMVAPNLTDDFLWDETSPLAGGGLGWVAGVARRDMVSDCDPGCDCACPPEEPDCGCGCIPEGDCLELTSTVNRVIAQGFGCNFPIEQGPSGCFSDGECGVGERCSTSPELCEPVDEVVCDAEGCESALCAGRCLEVAEACLDVYCVVDGNIPLCPLGTLPGHVDCGWACVDPTTCAPLGGPVPDAGPGPDDGGVTDGGGGLDDAGAPDLDGGTALDDAGSGPAADAGSADAG